MVLANFQLSATETKLEMAEEGDIILDVLQVDLCANAAVRVQARHSRRAPRA